MVEEVHMPIAEKGLRKRNIGKKKGSKGRKKLKMLHGSGEKVKINKKMQKLFQKRARDYNSDDDVDDNQSAPVVRDENAPFINNKEEVGGDYSDAEEEDDVRDADTENEMSDNEEESEIQPGITRFTEGCRAFRLAFKGIITKSVADDGLGPVLSAHKKLVVEKLAEEEAERKVKGVAKKEKHLVGEKGHVKPLDYLDSHEKFLIGVATKGVVKLFNAVNKAQNAQKGLNPSGFKDEKVLRKRRKQAFFSELSKTSSPAADTLAKGSTSGSADGEGPAWAPLRDSYMLTNSKLKNWDKMPDTTVTNEIGKVVEEDSSSDDD
ncbi:Rrp15p domain-containing protein [Cephalotus follicularis]|uniref:Rrp15p domain-containing protein n=1 Tax=Cephalotus follicularis TaxID=3775 RepID=A0A1Q3BKJ1_CEPFO|nr:Rrp15p domain-containing protein [Cephalotus follicularis]